LATERTVRDLYGTGCTCRWYRLRHAEGCPEVPAAEQPTLLGEVGVDWPDQISYRRSEVVDRVPFLDAWGNVVEELPVQPMRVRPYVLADETRCYVARKLCDACQVRHTLEDEDFCEECDNFTYVRAASGAIMAYGHRVNLSQSMKEE
jgi:hypothetical protein